MWSLPLSDVASTPRPGQRVEDSPSTDGKVLLTRGLGGSLDDPGNYQMNERPFSEGYK